MYVKQNTEIFVCIITWYTMQSVTLFTSIAVKHFKMINFYSIFSLKQFTVLILKPAVSLQLLRLCD